MHHSFKLVVGCQEMAFLYVQWCTNAFAHWLYFKSNGNLCSFVTSHVAKTLYQFLEFLMLFFIAPPSQGRQKRRSSEPKPSVLHRAWNHWKCPSATIQGNQVLANHAERKKNDRTLFWTVLIMSSKYVSIPCGNVDHGRKILSMKWVWCIFICTFLKVACIT